MSEINHEIGKQRESALLLKTDQTIRIPTYLDDGYYQKGITKLYDILTTGRYSETTGITLNGKTDTHSNNCVYDKNTKLMWSRYATATLGPNSNGTLPWTTNANGEGIFAYTAAANAAKLATYSDWRIPNINELASLFNYAKTIGTPNVTAFPAWPINTFFWTSTTKANSPTQSWSLGYNWITIYPWDKINSYNSILVRQG